MSISVISQYKADGRAWSMHSSNANWANNSLYFSASLKIWNIVTEVNNWDTASTTRWKSRSEHETAIY